MKIGERLQTVTRIFLDTAPVIYYIEDDVRYAALMERVFERIEGNALTVVTSPVTLAECLVVPYRQDQSQIVDAFTDLIVAGANTLFVRIDQEIAKRAAELRARYNLSLTDAFQVAAALESECDAFLTNDTTLGRVTELSVIVLEEMEV